MMKRQILMPLLGALILVSSHATTLAEEYPPFLESGKVYEFRAERPEMNMKLRVLSKGNDSWYYIEYYLPDDPDRMLKTRRWENIQRYLSITLVNVPGN